MGHVRIGFLPHTRQWNAIVEQLSLYDNDANVVAIIADRTLDAVRMEFDGLQYDESVIKAISYLATIVVSSRQKDQIAFLQENGYSIDENLSVFGLTTSAKKMIHTDDGSLETNKLARDSAIQAVMEYYEQHSDKQVSLFQIDNNPFKERGSGREFCELARFFSPLLQKSKFVIISTVLHLVLLGTMKSTSTFLIRSQNSRWLLLSTHLKFQKSCSPSQLDGSINMHWIVYPPMTA